MNITKIIKQLFKIVVHPSNDQKHMQQSSNEPEHFNVQI